MCGIFSAVGDLSQKQDGFIRDMFVLDSLRGPHSCGMLNVVGYSSDVHVFKKAMLPHDFLDAGGFKTQLAKKNKVIIGHNRWASKGKVNHTNAHPFTVGNITGVHNGTLRMQHLLPDHVDYDVDSENIFHAIDKIGIDETWKLISGAAALMWWDAKEKTVNMIRNKERPLHFCYSKDLRTMYTGSEPPMLRAGLWRNNLDHHNVEELPVDTLYTFTLDLANADPKKRVLCTTRKLASYQPPAIVTSQTYGGKSMAYKTAGTIVDFVVDKITYFQRSTVYDCTDNATGLSYRIDTVIPVKNLQIDSLATGLVRKRSNKHCYIDPNSVAFNSSWHYTGKDAHKNDDKEEVSTDVSKKEQEDTKDGRLSDSDWDKLHNTDCDMCTSPIDKDESYLLTDAGQLFCSACKDTDLVLPYIYGSSYHFNQ